MPIELNSKDGGITLSSKGVQGPQGEQGIQGETGPQGPTGPQGSTDFVDLTGSPSDNTALAADLNSKINKAGDIMTGNLTFDSSTGAIFEDQNGEEVGFVFASNEAMELLGKSADSLPFPIRVDGASFVIQADQIGAQFQGTDVGNVLYCEAEVDANGKTIYKIGTTPIIGSAYEDSYTSSSDVALTTSYQKIVFGSLTNSYTQANARASTAFKVVNSSNSEVEVEYYITVDGNAPAADDIFSGFVGRQSGGVDGEAFLSGTDTADSDLNSGQELQLWARMASGSGVTIKGTEYSTQLKIEETLTQSLQSFGEQVVNIEGDAVLSTGEEDDYLISWDATTRTPKVIQAKDIGSQSTIMVRDESDFGTIDSTKVYFIDGIVSITSSIEVPASGINIIGSTFDVSQLVSTENNFTMFTSPVGGSGNFLAENVAFETSGTSSKVFDLVSATGFDAFEFSIVNFNNCTSLGQIDGYRQGLETGTGRFGGTPELTLIGTWLGGYFIDTSIVRSLTDGAYSLYKAGTGFTMNSRFRSNQNIDLPASANFIDFSPSNFPNAGTVQLTGMELTRDGVYNADDTNLTPNIDRGDLACYWKGNNGLPNTYVGGTISVISEELTSIAAGSTWYTLEGVFLGTGLQHFSASADGKLTHLGSSPREFEFTADLTLESTSNNELAVRWRRWDASASAFVDLEYTERVRQVNALVGGRDVAFFTMIFGGIMDKDDYIQLQVKNNSGNNNVTMETDSFFRVQER